MSKAEFVEYMNKRLEQKARAKALGEKQAKYYTIDNFAKINKRIDGERRRRGYRW